MPAIIKMYYDYYDSHALTQLMLISTKNMHLVQIFKVLAVMIS